MSRHGIYERYIKRILDVVCSLIGIIVFGWLYIAIAILVRTKLGTPILFKQPRPGRDEKIFFMYKFRTMTNARDEEGNLLPDEIRMTKFGKILRETSLDELPEVFCIVKGEMSILGPRPLLVKDMVFMSKEHRRRHLVRPGLSGFAQVSGRNEITWENKLDYDIQYIENITFWGDIKILLYTILKVLIREGITEEGKATSADYGDYLLQSNQVNREDYDKKQEEALKLLNENQRITSLR